MENKKNKYYVGKIKEFAKRRGWFFGYFMDEPLLHSDMVEVSWQKVPNAWAHAEQKHYHKQSVEINIVISGWIQITINGTEYKFTKGNFYVIWPYTTVENISTSEDAELIVVRTPSLSKDRFDT
jgi:mannose-6-phosphate isomerase-like protein (cupin superfamily)